VDDVPFLIGEMRADLTQYKIKFKGGIYERAKKERTKEADHERWSTRR
jgi:hypothetical protein